MVKCVVKLKNCLIGTQICVVVDIDPVIMIVLTKRQKGKKDKNTKGQKDKKYKDMGPKGPPQSLQELEQGAPEVLVN